MDNLFADLISQRAQNQLHRVLGVTLKTAWFMSMRLSTAMGDGRPVPRSAVKALPSKLTRRTLAGNGRTSTPTSVRVKGNGPTNDKAAVFALVERNGRARAYHVPEVSGANLRQIVASNVQRGSKVYSDDNHTTRFAARDFENEFVDHRDGEYVRGDVHSNTVEGYFAILKRGIIGTYHHVSERPSRPCARGGCGASGDLRRGRYASD